MALLSPLFSLTTTPPPTTSIKISSSFAIKLQNVSVALHPTFRHGLQAHAPEITRQRCAIIVKASAADKPAGEAEDQSENDEDNIPIQNLPLESKLQLKLEQKMKMKIAKKVRLRRKRLMRKRMMRKKGRWPPSKMKKLKNV
ncbi:50S ribosomal protein 5 alpha, chloroplastic-like [Amaranthus tricolor]|uniref:50S ribosomal protein 5 alpha, chloroplastic-like n=1 Tax=Amaranthus tricolor TaxID=29722 RepID=UPI00258DDADF|nr:50S ribosomal protein 5 alpha, chloroplastic-like [Amaranthus tricolor]